MAVKYTPEAPVDIRAELTCLRRRKQVLDELIVCLERYHEVNIRPPRRAPDRERAVKPDGKRAGAA
jgi:hypothetical protein